MSVEDTVEESVADMLKKIEKQVASLNSRVTILERKVALCSPVVYAIYKSHFLKGASTHLLWKAHNIAFYEQHLTTPKLVTEVDIVCQSYTGLLHDRQNRAISAFKLHHRLSKHNESPEQLLAYEAALRQPPSASSTYRTNVKQMSQAEWQRLGIHKDVLSWITGKKEVVRERNAAARVVTARQLAEFISLEDPSPERDHFAALFKLIFRFSFSEIEEKSESEQNTILTNSGSNPAIFDLQDQGEGEEDDHVE
ncbi:hypothetical protein C8F01DRAFT_1224857 [Mycena amicta]|nr:hypothetical protein C8F01DRAFT_1224857 [Mycena amicta]